VFSSVPADALAVEFYYYVKPANSAVPGEHTNKVVGTVIDKPPLSIL
jgi:hypothetical protein